MNFSKKLIEMPHKRELFDELSKNKPRLTGATYSSLYFQLNVTYFQVILM